MGRRRRWILALAAAPLAIVACNAINGSSDLEIIDGDGSAALPDRAAGDENVVVVDGGPGDAPVDAGCVPRPTLLEAGVLAAYAATKPKHIDGVFDDWGCEEPFVLDTTNAAYFLGDAGMLRAEVRVEWEPGHVNVAFVVTPPTPPTGANAQPIYDDAVEVYLSPPGTPSGGDYRSVDRHFVVDYRGIAMSYVPYEAGVGPGPGFDSKALVTGAGFTVEERIPPSALGVKSFAAGDVLPFDLQLDLGDGNAQVAGVVWTMSPPLPCACATTCCCGAPAANNDLPFCDTHRFGTLVLQP